jgi:phosphopantetheine--protein transferase-like protein
MKPEIDTSDSPINGLTYAPEWAGTNIYLACLPVGDWADLLHPDEWPAIATAGALRQRTFASGRQCARAALAEAGLPASSLPRAADGAVIWPDGVIGSVSHTNEWAVAAIALRAMSEASSLGVDLERIQPLEAGVLKLVATDTERTELTEAGSKRWHATALFSLKEAVYKCLRPSYARFIEFHEVEICELAGGRPRLRLCSDALSAHCRASDVELRVAVTPAHVFALAWLRDR